MAILIMTKKIIEKRRKWNENQWKNEAGEMMAK